MRPNLRSASGALLMLMIVPVIVGLLACMPVPIGNPERSRIDPAITGVWLSLDGDPAFYVFEPYDKRTWLVTGIPLEEGADADFSGYDFESYDDVARLMETEKVGADGATATGVAIYKAWVTKLGSAWFMVWEPKTRISEENFQSDYWWVMRFDKPVGDVIELSLVDGEDEVFKDVEETRRAYERVLKKNLDNEDLFSDEVIRMQRVQEQHLRFFAELAEEVVETD